MLVGENLKHSEPDDEKAVIAENKKGDEAEKPTLVSEKKHKKTLAELDEELRMKMSGIAGDGGEAGVELEDGKVVGLSRSVRENMFRYI